VTRATLERRTVAEASLIICIFYEGPWSRLESLFLGIRRDCTLRWEIPAQPRGWRRVLGWLGDYCDRKDASWRRRYARQHRTPPGRWKR
jgi:hypothetical protein